MTRYTTGDGFPDVVVTGLAMTTALATDVDTTWKMLLDGQSGIRKLTDPFVEKYDLPVLHSLDPRIDLDVVAGGPRPTDYRYAVSNSFGFGGHNVALAFGMY